MEEHQLGQSELSNVVGRYGQIAVEPDILDDLFNGLVFPQ